MREAIRAGNGAFFEKRFPQRSPQFRADRPIFAQIREKDKLLSYPKKTFSRAQLMDEFWDVDSDTSLRAVDVYMTKLRNKLSDCDGFKLVTVRGVGYKAVLQ